mgnify:CR=1 FL=1
MVYKTKGTCSVEINFDVIDGRLHDVKFTGGYNGNPVSYTHLTLPTICSV